VPEASNGRAIDDERRQSW